MQVFVAWVAVVRWGFAGFPTAIRRRGLVGPVASGDGSGTGPRRTHAATARRRMKSR
jgi:hypothetical protein